MSSAKYVRPLCLGTSGSVRATSIPRSAMWASVFQTFWPLTTHSSPSRTARVASDARSEPAPGSLKSWHQTSSPVKSGRRSGRARVSVRVRHDRRCGEVQPEAVPAGLGELDLLGAEPALDHPLERRVDAEPAEADGEVHPRESEVVLRAAGTRPGRRRRGPDQLVGERFDLLGVSHGQSVGRTSVDVGAERIDRDAGVDSRMTSPVTGSMPSTAARPRSTPGSRVIGSSLVPASLEAGRPAGC